MDGLEKGIILKVLTGSHCHGTALPESDKDTRGIIVPDISHFFGTKSFEQYENKAEDTVFFGFKKYIHLASKGNLSALNFLFVHKKDILYADKWGQRILDFRENFLSHDVINCIYGYVRSQLHRMERGSGRCGNRSDLLEKYGYDTKFAYHAVMITNIGIELLKTGTYHCLRSDGEQKILMRIRKGEQSYEETMRMIKENLTVMSTLEPIGKVRKELDKEKVNQFCVEFLKDYFKE